MSPTWHWTMTMLKTAVNHRPRPSHSHLVTAAEAAGNFLSCWFIVTILKLYMASSWYCSFSGLPCTYTHVNEKRPGSIVFGCFSVFCLSAAGWICQFPSQDTEPSAAVATLSSTSHHLFLLMSGCQIWGLLMISYLCMSQCNPGVQMPLTILTFSLLYFSCSSSWVSFFFMPCPIWSSSIPVLCYIAATSHCSCAYLTELTQGETCWFLLITGWITEFCDLENGPTCTFIMSTVMTLNYLWQY